MSSFPDLKFWSQIKGLDLYAHTISQGYSQLTNSLANKDSNDYHNLKDYTLETINECRGIFNQMESNLIG